MKFTVDTIKRLKLPSGKNDHTESDDTIPGWLFRMRPTRKGLNCYWQFDYPVGDAIIARGRKRRRRRRITFGRYPAMSVPKARETAEQLHAESMLGRDPQAIKQESRRRAVDTFEVCVKLYLAWLRKDAKKKPRPSTLREIERHLTVNLRALNALRIDVDRRALALELAKIAPVQANRTASSAHKFFKWCAGEGFIELNPATGLNKNPEMARDRVLTDAELREIWMSAGNDHYGSIIRLLMLTGQRAGEIAGLKRSEIGQTGVPEGNSLDGVKLPAFAIDAIDLPGERTKNKRPHLVPLSKPVLAILRAQPVRTNRDLIFGAGQRGFSGWSKAKERHNARIHAARLKPWSDAGRQGNAPGPMDHWTPHDLRRTLHTMMNDRLGILPHVVEAVVNHASTAASGKAGVAGVYNKALYLRERVAALQLWADYVTALVGENVVPLHRVG
jgi:integrase